MKVFISADIEGVATTAKWPETNPSEREYSYHREEMTQEVLAACHAAIDSGATEILIKDAHGPATNIDSRQLPECASIVKGWEGHPYMMVQGIDRTFDAAMFIGYHSEAGGTGNPSRRRFLILYRALKGEHTCSKHKPEKSKCPGSKAG